jgi:carbamoyl-phosphate synthase large subunit
MEPFNILFTSAGRRVSLIKHFRKSLLQMGVEGKLITADMNRHAPAAFVSDLHVLVPKVTDDGYIDKLIDICKEQQIRLLIPLVDTELQLLANRKKQFEQLGVTLLVCSPEVNEICFDKRNTYQFFRDIRVNTPKVLDPELLLNDPNSKYPFFLKPATGSSSKGATIIHNARELDFFKDYIADAIIQENIEGEEFTLDVLVDFQEKVRCVVPRKRIETRAGEVSKGMTVKHAEIMAKGKEVVEKLPGAFGCVTVQCFLTASDEIFFIEINPRFGGGFPLSINAGADFPRWIVEMVLGIEGDAERDWKDGVVMLRYDDEIIVSKEMIYDQSYCF